MDKIMDLFFIIISIFAIKYLLDSIKRQDEDEYTVSITRIYRIEELTIIGYVLLLSKIIIKLIL